MAERLKTNKIILSVFSGIILSLAALFCYVNYYFFDEGELDLLALIIFFISLIAFFILWNIKNSKLVYILLILPLLFFAGPVSLEISWKYHDYVNTIPRMPEDIERLGDYEPGIGDPDVGKRSRLARLNGESTLKIKDNLPVLDGATALYPLYSSFVDTVYPLAFYHYWKEYSIVLCSRTPYAYNNLLNGKADMIFCFEPSESQREQFKEKGLKLNLVPIGKDAFVFFVNKKNKVNNLTVKQIQGIYSGRIKNWIRLGGKLQSIKPFQRAKNSGSQTILEKIMGGIPIIKSKGETVLEYMHSVFYEVASYRNFKNAVGYSFLWYTTEMINNDQIKLLSINGIPPSKETIQNETYPFSQNIYAIYADDNKKKENIELFIKWILSDQGQGLVSKTGYIPIKNE
jgi:phosphate transport system substrate-binding protein